MCKSIPVTRQGVPHTAVMLYCDSSATLLIKTKATTGSDSPLVVPGMDTQKFKGSQVLLGYLLPDVTATITSFLLSDDPDDS